MLSLKLATEKDALAVSVLFKELHEHSVYKDLISYEHQDVAALVTKLAEDPNSGVTIMMEEDGRLIGAIMCSTMQQVFNQSEKTAVEIGFWITPKHRTPTTLKKLLQAYRYWAKRIGCTSILQGKLTDRNNTETYTIRKL
jgi:flavorubredoxin